MLSILKKLSILFISLCLAAPFSVAHANADWQLMQGTPSCQKTDMEKCTKCSECTAGAKKNPKQRPRKISKKHRTTVAVPKKELELYNLEPGNSKCTDRACIIRYCKKIPEKKVACEIVNPADLVENTCTAIVENLNSCQAYSCQAPAAQDPTIKTQWNIVRKSGDRCVVSSTTEDMGIKDINGKVLAITQSCEYDKIGIQALVRKFKDSEKRYFHFSTCEHYEGIYNCSFTSNGKSIRDAKIGS